ncbi:MULTISPECIES: DinB family protein [Paenibacillus]|uniref:DinB family protein n=1 Tax=Paenibacillus cucumis (ex Kampfer et al. 2016) TaxID=1776858 RepID=A0ABS7KFY9_9BACL|nr:MULTISPECIES: DinB family protein [Paenibacillus]MBY0203063.1 DinB family protein [Paenibacillus cucumis (ex Kampfer et al. 2016)]
MNGTLQIREHLLTELETGVRTGASLIRLIRPEDWAYRPQDNMRSLVELVHHFIQITASDLVIMQEKGEAEVGQVEDSLSGNQDIEQLEKTLWSNFEAYKAYITSLSEEDFLNRSTKAFYAEHGHLQVQWQIETLTHVFHHRSQLYNYLKQQGHELNFFMLYA